MVTVSFDLQGRKWVKDGEEKYITSVRGYKIEERQTTQQQVAQQQVAQNYAPAGQWQQPAPQAQDEDGLPF